MENTQILKEIAVQLIGFAVVFFVLKKLAWSKLLGAIDARRKGIADQYSAIEQGRKSLEALEQEYRRKLEGIEQEARVKIQEAANVGTALARDIQEKARLDAQGMVQRAKDEIDQDLKKARLSMRNEIVEISSLMAERVLKEKLDAKDHEKLVDKFLKEIESIS